MDLINKKKTDILAAIPKDESAGKKKKVVAVAAPKEEEKKAAVAESEEGASTGKSLSDIIGRDIEAARNSEDVLKKHRAATGGKIMTRFPPEPNGYLHIGHAKAMRFNFTFAKENGGMTYLRYDDTNPVKENQEFIDNIRNCVEWLGYKPFKITFASDYFQELYDLACELIKRGKAYVDHCSKPEIKEQRNKMIESPYRNRSVEENLKLFNSMRQGRFAENECCLRMKIDMTHVNPNMRDPVAYRIRYVPHPHAGDKWCIYPTYDYTHCINDSLENITHSLCTLEFENRRESYYWLLEALDLYKPMVWEYSRLNLTYTVLSKRKLEKLVGERVVTDWEDPRMPTVLGLRRRGYTPSMINDFAAEIGVSRKGNDNVTSIRLLEHYARKELDVIAPRTFGVQDPVLLEIVNFDEVANKDFEAPLFPADKTKGTQIYKLSRRVFIDEEDFSVESKKGFFGLTPEQPVCLKYGPVV
jgi:glutaminyl-tRNA synthetase